MDFQNFRFGNHTDVGRTRQQNEDYLGFFENSNGYFFVVCDGMGGHAGGATASQTAVKSIRSFFENQFYPNPQEAIYQAIQYANQQIYQLAQMNIELRGMGTTCVLLMLRENKFYYGHVGDSRIYLHANRHLQRLTKDHSFVMALVEQGLISEADAEKHPRRNELLRALGTESFVDVTVAQEPILPQNGDMFLLCSDGLNSLVLDEGIEEVMNMALEIQHKAMRLVEIANNLGGFDNITIQLIEFTGNTPADNLLKSSLGNTNPFSQPKQETTDFSKKKLKSYEPELEDVTPISESRAPKRKKKKEFIEMENMDNYDYQPILLRGFLILFAAVVLFIFYKNTIGKSNIIGSTGDLKKDSLTSIGLENQLYEYFWNSSPELKKVKNTIDETTRTIKEIKDFKNNVKARLDSFFQNKTVKFVRNSLNQESGRELARRYRSKLDWILKANGVKSEDELKKLDSLVVPLEAPDLPKEEKVTDEKQPN